MAGRVVVVFPGSGRSQSCLRGACIVKVEIFEIRISILRCILPDEMHRKSFIKQSLLVKFSAKWQRHRSR